MDGTCPRVPGPSSRSRTRFTADWLALVSDGPFQIADGCYASLGNGTSCTVLSYRVLPGVPVTPAQVLDEQIQRPPLQELHGEPRCTVSVSAE